MPEKIANYDRSAEREGSPLLGALLDSLKPFPGRGGITLRLAVACTLIVLVSYTFRMPFQDLMPFFVLFITKEEKVTTIITALLVLFAVTIAIAGAILIYKLTGDRPEFRIPGIALEIFVGMYLFRVLAIGAVGWIIGFVCAATQSLVYLSPSAEETVHQFLWLWVAIAFSIGVAWAANLLLFPISPVQLLQQEFVAGWQAVSLATRQLAAAQLSKGAQSLRPLVKRGPIRLLKLLKLSLMESRDLSVKQVRLRHIILGLDKIPRLIFSCAKTQFKSSAPIGISSGELAILERIDKEAENLKWESEAGLIAASPAATLPGTEMGANIPLRLLEAENIRKELATQDGEPENRPQSAAAAARRKPSLFIPDAFSNPRHVQFALKVTLAGMLGYLFYTTSDYYGIHTVFYTPLIIALASTGATIHKGLLRILGCIIGGGLGLIFSIWLIPRFETFETFLLVIFWVHALAAWVAVGNERISYMGLQIALTFDLGFLQGYGPPENVDPLRDRFIGIVLGICILTTVFAVIWPESADSSARERLAACLRTIGRLLRLRPLNDGSQNWNSQREQLELEIASRLSEANAYEEQAAFEELVHGSATAQGPTLEDLIGATEEIYVCSLPWMRKQSSGQTIEEGAQPGLAAEISERVSNAIEASANRIHPDQSRIADQNQTPIGELIEKADLDAGKHDGGFGELLSAVVELEILVGLDLPRSG